MKLLHRVAIAVVAALPCVAVAARSGEDRTALAVFDQMLDARVRDGFVYYRALKVQRTGLDRYVTSLANAEVPRDRNDQIAFWVNAYNAVVLQTVIDHYPIRSLRMVAGAFQAPHRIGGRTVSLDQIEQSILGGFHEPRVFFALERGAAGSGRLRSEIYTGESLDHQLQEQLEECAGRDRCIRVDPKSNRIQASQIFQWRRKEFAEAYATASGKRPPLEQAVVAIAALRRTDVEREVLARDRFGIEYLPFDWSLNDLAQRPR